MSSTSRRIWPPLVLALTLITVLAGFGNAALAAATDIATAPLGTSTPTSIRPNLLFILDDSGSMAGNFLPDEANFASSKYGLKASQCNGLAYKPSTNYKPPVNSVGASSAPGSLSVFDVATGKLSSITSITSLPAPTVASGSLTVTVGGSGSYSTGNVVTVYSDSSRSQWMYGTVTAWNGTSRQLTVNVSAASGSGTMLLPKIGAGDGVPSYFSYSGSQAKLGYTYTSSGVITSTDFYKECNSSIGSTPGSAVFARVTVSANSADAQNYANWSAYYQTRMQMMQAATSLAFKDIGDSYRVGFTTISDTTVTSSDFVNVDTFDATHKLAFYTKLFAATPGSYTPLRGALSKAGQYYAKKASGQTYDPVQYSCQKNFTLLSTDGYWNTNTETSSYGPYKLDRTTSVGQQDGPEPYPFFDGAKYTTKTVEKYSTTSTTVKTVVTPMTRVDTSTATTTTATPSNFTRNQYSGPTYSPIANNTGANFGRCAKGTVGNCTITVTTQTTLGLPPGNSVVTISQVGTSAYNGQQTVTRVDDLTYTFTLSSRPSADSGGYSFYSPVGCPSGQGKLTTQAQRQDRSTVSTSEVKNKFTTMKFDRTVVTTTDTVTPYTVTTTTINGVASVNTVAGTPTTSSTPVTTYGLETDTGSTYTYSARPADTTTSGSWTDYGSSVVSTTCSTMPSPNPSAATATSGWVSPGPVTSTSTTPVTPGSPNPGTPVSTSTVGPSAPVKGATTPVSTTTTSTGGVSDSLADVAMYYYKTDLRDTSLGNCTGSRGTDVCTNNVSPKGADDAKSQHMTTFTLGLGVNGLLKYDPNYLTQTAGDYFDITQGAQNWPLPGPSMTTENIDDLWHAAVNGRGQYFSAGDPVTLAASLDATLKSIENKLGSASAAAASNLQPVQGDNKLFIAQYVTGQWTGDLIAKTIGTTTGVITNDNLWSAKTKLDAKVSARSISYFRKDASGNTGVLHGFNYTNLTADLLNGNFDAACSKTIPLSQCATLAATAADLTNPTAATAAAAARAKVTGLNVVDFLAGVRTYEQSAASASDQVFRTRVNLLGDIVGGAPVYVKKPPFKYTENGYAGFASGNSTRTGVVFVGANDGMLHAFAGETGEELWAHIPSFVLPNLYRLADADYANRHEYFVDGAPVIGDIFVGGAWKTILVGGLGGGGRGYYALDITDTTAPKALWEFTTPDLGLSFGNPVITKRADGTWVVAIASGYNNNTGGGDGNGHLFVLNANTGAELLKINTYTTGTTPAGTTTTPSGLAKLNAWVDSEIDNTAKRFYGGDLLGNLWRFDVDNLVAPNQAALRMAYLQNGSPLVPEPITTAPQLAEIKASNGAKYPVVYVGTGQFLGTADLGTTAKQSVYALRDYLTATGLGDVHASSSVVVQTLTQASAFAALTISSNPVDWTTKDGWRVDFLTAGERVNVEPQLLFNTLTVATNVPRRDDCSDGSSYLYRFDINSGSSALGAGKTVGTWLGNTMVVGLSFVQLQKATGGDPSAGGSGDTVTIVVDNNGNVITSPVPPPPPDGGATRRTSWRELVD